MDRVSLAYYYIQDGLICRVIKKVGMEWMGSLF